MKRLLLLIAAILYVIGAYAQDCPRFDEIIGRAKRRWAAGKFEEAFNQLNAAREHCPAKAAEVDALFLKFTNDIAKKYKEAEENREKAEMSAKQLKMAFQETENARFKADSALAVAEKLINAFYFYEDKYALAYSDNKYFFINKHGTYIKKLGQWDKAEQFDYTGFAKVKWKNGQQESEYLIDTIGNQYPVSYSINEITPEIRALDLSGNNLAEIPEKIFNYEKLQILILNNNVLSKIDTNICKLNNLTHLFISSNKIKIIPDAITRTENIKIIDFSFNNINNLPSDINKLANLAYLNLSRNNISEMPESICELSKIEYLDLSNNNISSISDNIGHLIKLKYLNFSGNQIAFLPNSIGLLSELNLINISYNKISKLPDAMNGLKELCYLYLPGNNVSAICQQVGSLSKLREIDITENPLSEIEIENYKITNPRCKIINSVYQGVENSSFKAGNYLDAYYDLKKIAENNPSDMRSWYALSWYALFAGEYDDAINAAKKVLEIDEKATGVEANIALALLLSNQWKEAKYIYERLKGQEFSEDKSKIIDDIFLSDIEELERVGIYHPDYEKVREMFQERETENKTTGIYGFSFSLYAGFFKEQTEAERHKNRLLQLGYTEATLAQAKSGWYNVQVNRYTTRAEAEAVQQELKEKHGIAAWLEEE